MFDAIQNFLLHVKNDDDNSQWQYGTATIELLDEDEILVHFKSPWAINFGSPTLKLTDPIAQCAINPNQLTLCEVRLGANPCGMPTLDGLFIAGRPACRSCYNKSFSLKGPKVSTCAACSLAVDDWLYQETIGRYGQCYCPAHYQFAIEGRLIEADDPDALLERLLSPLIP